MEDQPVSKRLEQLMQDDIIKGPIARHRAPSAAELSDRFRDHIDYAYPVHADPVQIGEAKVEAVHTPNHYAVNGMFELADLLAGHPHLSGFRMQAIQYTYRADIKSKGDKEKEIEDLEKAIKFLTFEIRLLKGEPVSDTMRKYIDTHNMVAAKEAE